MANGHTPPLARVKPASRHPVSSLHTSDASFPLAESSPGVGASHFSLAHELAAATMPNPGPNSSLAEELGLDLDDDNASDGVSASLKDSETNATTTVFETKSADVPIVGAEHGFSSLVVSDDETHDAIRPVTRQPPSPTDGPLHTPYQSRGPIDTLEQLAQELAATDAFITRLKHLDTDIPRDSPTHTLTSELPIERYTSRIIRQLNDTTRERESQIRELVSIDNEFRRIEGEVGGGDVLGSLDTLDDNDRLFTETGGLGHSTSGRLQPLGEADELDEGNDPEDITQDGAYEDPHSPVGSRAFGRAQQLQSDTHSPYESLTPAGAIPHLTRMRDVTTSLARSLSVMGEHAQENRVATADAGRKLRALKNRIVVWQTEWDSAETSRAKIEQWETDAIECVRIDGRVIVQQQMEGFAQALADAALKTQAIVTSS